MHNDLLVHWMVGHRQIVRVQDAASAVFLGIDKHDDVLIRITCQHVVQTLEIERCKITVRIECVKMASKQSIAQNSL